MLRTVFLGTGLALAAGAPSAAPVTLLPGTDQVVATDDFGLQGRFAGTGFAFDAETEEFLDPISEGGEPAEIGSINDGLTGFTRAVQRLTISAPVGRAFDLLSLDIPLAYFGTLATYEGTAEDGEDVVNFVFPLFESVVLSGVTTAGSVIEESFVPVDDAATFFSSLFAENPDPTFGSEAFGPGFEDLVSLTFTAGGPSGLETVCDPANLANVDPRFALSEPCADAPGPLTGVEVELELVAGSRNDNAFYEVAAVTVDVAPIPVPASLPLLLGGLGALALGARRGARRAG